MPLLLAVALVAAACGALAFVALGRARRRASLRRRQGRAQTGEREAERLLRACGYEVLERQARVPWPVTVDGEPVPVELRADYLVRRAGRDYVAEVKTGQDAPSARTPTTRRQLLEYGLAYPVAGTLLVDMEAGRIHEVCFPLAEPRAAGAPSRRRWGLLWSALCVCIGWLLARG